MEPALRRVLRPLAAVLVLASIVLAGPVAPADAAYRNFGGPRFATTEPGDIIMAANTLLTCPASTSCTNAQNGAGTARANNDYNMIRVDVDNALGLDPTNQTNISSAASLALPAGAQVRFAGLYWGAVSSNAANRPNVRFSTPVSGGYLNLTASQVDDNGGGTTYQSFRDVTALVQTAGAGQYVVGGIEAQTGSGRHAGWSLVVVYGDTSQPYRNLTVFDGFQQVTTGNPINITVNGFLTPPTGPVTGQIGFVTYEGDDRFTGDFAQLNGQQLNDAVNPATNFFNSRISNKGVLATVKNPNYVDQLGFDATITNTVGVIPAGATSATITMDSAGDWYYPGVVTAAIDVYVPNLILDLNKSVTDDNGGDVNPGDVLTYNVVFSNQGDDAGLDVVLSDAIPANTSFVPGSLLVVTGENAGSKTDATGDDTGYFDSGGNQVVFHLGTGATPIAGGRVAPFAVTGITYRAQFKVMVDPGSEGLTAVNEAFLSYTGETISDSYSSPTNQTSSPIVAQADVKLTAKNDSVDPVFAGGSLQWTIDAANDGPSAADNVVITDTLPSGLVFDAAASDSRCTTGGSVVTCALGTMAPSSSDSVVIAVDVSSSKAGGTLTNTAQIGTTTQDRTTANDFATEQTTVERLVDLEVTKTASPSPLFSPNSAIAGEQIDYLLTVSNNGPASATNVALSDLLPSGTTVTSTTSTGSCNVNAGVIDCQWPNLAVGASVTLAVNLDIDPGTSSATVLTNSASATADEAEDPSGQPQVASVDTPVVRLADLSLTKNTADTPIAGSTLTWDLLVSNAGPSHATSVTVVDPLPAGTTFDSGSSSSGCSESGGIVTCTVAQVDAGDSTSFAIGVRLDPTTADGTSITNSASVSSDEPDPATANNDASDSIAVTRVADLSILKSGPGTINAGGQLQYVLDITNAGPSAASNVAVSDVLPPEVTLSSAPGCAGTTTITCSLGNLSVGASASFTITVDVPSTVADGINLVNAASVTADESDPNNTDNDSQLTTNTDRSTALEITKSESAGTPDPVLAGTNVSWDITVTNLSTSADDNIVISDDLSGQPVIGPLTATISGVAGSCSVSGLAVSCSVPSLPGNSSALVVISGTADPSAISGDTIINSANAVGDFSSLVTATEETTINAETDLTLSKSGPSDLIAGETGVWSIQLTNSGPALARSVEVTDLLPTGVTYVSSSTVPGSISCTPVGANVSCTIGTLGPGATATIDLTARVERTSPAGSMTNSASVSSTTTDPDPASDVASVSTTVTRSAEIELTKTAATPNTTAGNTVSFSLTATNNGPSMGTALALSDTIGAGFTFNPALSDAGCGVSGGDVICAVGDIDPLAAPVTVNVTFDVDASQPPGAYTNSAALTANETDPDLSNNQDTANFTVDALADLTLVKSSPAAAVVPGETYTYTLDVTNQGPSVALSNSVTDTLPAGTTLASGSSATCVEAPTGTVTCATSDLNPSDTESLTIALEVDPARTGSLSNNATLSSATVDPDSSNNSANDTSPVIPAADLTISKAAPATVNAGGTLTWVIDVTNIGPSLARNSAIDDVLPSQVTFSGTSDPSCTAVGSDVTCVLGDLAPGQSVSVNVIGNVDVSATEGALLTNSAVVSADPGDPDLTNNTDSVDTRVERSADISLTKTASGGTPVAGGTITYEMTLGNSGPSTATAVAFIDTLPPALTPLSATPSGGGSCSTNGQEITCSAPQLLPGQTLDVEIEAQIDSGANVGDTITNTASSSAAEPDPASGNNTATESITVTRLADLAMTKTATSPTGVAGELVVWELQVGNLGPSVATNVAVTDTLGPQFSFDAAGSSPGCSASGSTVTCTEPTLANGTASTFTLSTMLDSSVPDGASASNTASVASSETDPDTANNTSTDSIAVNVSADLSISKSSPATPPVPGSTTVWPIAIINNGPSDAASVVLTDTLPPGSTFTSAGSSASCSLTGPGIVECTLASVAQGETVNLTVAADITSSRIGSLENLASVSSATSDPQSANNSDSTSDPLTPISDLVVTKTAITDPAVAGQEVEWLVEVTNLGPSDASGVQVIDVLGNDLTYVDASSDSRCDPVAGDIECGVGTLGAGATTGFTIASSLGTNVFNGAVISNDASVTSSSPDPDGSNNSATASKTVSRAADLSISKTPSMASSNAGDVAVWDLAVVNNGPSDATSIVVTDVLPSGATFDAATSSGTCSESGGTVSCTVADLVDGSGANLTIGMMLPSSLADGASVTNSASVSGGDSDPNTSNNSASASIAVTRQIDLEVTKNPPSPPAVPGQSTAWTVDVANNGPSDASFIVVTDTLPPTVTFDSAGSDPSCSESTPGTVSCTVALVAAGTGTPLVIAAQVSSGEVGNLSNAAQASAAEIEPDLSNNFDTAVSAVNPQADLSTSKTLNSSPIVAGEVVSWIIEVTNNGPSDAVNVISTDVFGPEMTFNPANSDTACTQSGSDVVCDHGSLPAGTSDSATVAFDLAADTPAGFTLANTATASSSTGDPDNSNDGSTASGPVTQSSDLSLSKLANNTTAIAGQGTSFQVVVDNLGPSDASNVSVTDVVPVGTTFNPGDSDSACALSGATITCSASGVPTGDSTTFRVAFFIDETFADGTTLTNSAAVSSDQPDPAGPNNSDSATSDIIRTADLALAKSAPSPIPIPGGATGWDLTVTNLGPSAASGIVITDSLPSGATFDSASSDLGCAEVSPGVVTCPIGDLTSGTAGVARLGVVLASGTPSPVTNDATVLAAELDPASANNNASSTALTSPSADLAVAKSLDTSPIVAGEQVSWTLSVTNSGPSDAELVVLTDTPPSSAAFVTGASDPACSQAATITCDAGTVAAGATETFVVTFDLDSSVVAGSTVTNSVSVSSTTPDPNGANDVASSSGTVTSVSDLSLAKVANTADATAGGVASFTVTATNLGSSDAENIVVTDAVPSGSSFNPASSHPSCSLTGTIVSCTSATLPQGTSVGFAVSFDLDSSLADGSVFTNSASVTSDSSDPDTANNSANAAVNVIRSTDLQITKTHNGQAVPGTVSQWTVVASNTGPSDATGMTVTDTLDSAATFDPGSSSAGCTESTPGTVSCVVSDVAAGSSSSVIIGAIVDPNSTGSIPNTAAIAGSEPDPNTANNQTTSNSVLFPSADLLVTKTLDTNPVVAGGPAQWTITVENIGPSAARNVSVEDIADFFATFDPTNSDADCSQAATVVCSTPFIAAGASRSFTLSLAIDNTTADGTPATNSATATAGTPDPNTGNNSGAASGIVTTESDLSLAKFALTPNVLAGEAVTWQLSVNNPGPSVASNVLIADPVPAGTTFDPGASDAACSLNGAVVECSFTSLAAGTTTTANVTFFVDSSVADGSSLTNSASVTAATNDPDDTNNSASNSVTISASADLRLIKSHSGPAVAGQMTVWTLVTSNLGPSDATGVLVTDTLPTGSAFDPTNSDPRCTEPLPGTVTCLLGNTASGTNDSVVISAMLGTGTTGQLTNTASVSGDQTDQDLANNSDSSTVDVESIADISVLKTLVTTNPVPGEPVEWLVTVNNLGPSDALAIDISDNFGPDLQFDPGASDSRCAAQTPGAVSCTQTSLLSGGSTSFTVMFDSDPSVVEGASLTNSADASSATNDPDDTNNRSDSAATFARSSDLAVTKTAPAAVAAGELVSYDLTTTNNGPSDAANVSMTDALPTELTGIVLTGDPSCSLSGSVVTCLPGTLAPGANLAVTIQGTVSSDTPDGTTLTNSASASSDSPDLAPANDSETASSNVTRAVDLVLSKSLLGPIVAGREVLWELSATNNGPSQATNIVFSDTLPAGLTFRPDLSSAGCSPGVTCTTPVLPAGATVTVVVGSDADPGLALGASLTNTASVTSDEAELDAATNDSSASGTVVRETDLAVLKQGPSTPVTAGTSMLWRIDIGNAGPSDGSGVVAVDTLPAGTSLNPATSDSRCSASGATVTCVVGNFGVGTTESLVIGVDVSSGVSDGAQLTNSVTISADQGDPDSANNTSTHTADIARSSGLTLSKVDLADPVVAGGQAIWLLTVRNPSGPSDTDNVTVTDILPPGVVFNAAASDSACVEAPAGTVTCTTPTVAVGSSATFTIAADLDSSLTAGTILTNAATATGDSAMTVSTSEETTVSREIDLAVAKTSSTPIVTPGVPLTYEITVANSGPSDASDVSIIDALPPGSAVSSVTPASDCTTTMGSVSCLIPTLPAGSTTTVTIDLTPESWLQDGSNFDNTAVASANETDTDPNNNTGQTDTPVERRVDVSISKTASNTNANAGDSVVYEIVASNAGPSDAADLLVSDTLPSGVTFNPSLSSPGCTASGAAVTCPVVSLAAGDSSSVVVGVEIDPATIGTITNAAVIATSETNTNPDPTDSTDVVVSDSADLTLTKDAPTSVVAGGVLSFRFEVLNNGPGLARNVIVTDELTTGLSVNVLPAECSDNNGTLVCSLGNLAVGDRSTIVLETLVDPQATQTIPNTATVSADASETNPGDNVSSTSTNVSRVADLSVSKSAVSVDAVAGGQITWLIEIMNQGPSTATGLTISDNLPTDLGIVASQSDLGCIEDPENSLVCDVGDLTPGETATVTLVTDVESTAFGVITNTVTAQSEENNPNPSSATANAAVEVRRPNGLLEVTKTGSKSPLKAGDAVTWTVVVANTGTEAILSPIVITDPVPQGHVFQSVVPGSPRCEQSSGSVVCNYVGLPAGESVEIRIRTRALADQKQAINTVMVTASGIQSGDDADGSVLVTATAQINATSALAFTGSSLRLLLTLAFGLLLAGWFFLIASKRRDEDNEDEEEVAQSSQTTGGGNSDSNPSASSWNSL